MINLFNMCHTVILFWDQFLGQATWFDRVPYNLWPLMHMKVLHYSTYKNVNPFFYLSVISTQKRYTEAFLRTVSKKLLSWTAESNAPTTNSLTILSSKDHITHVIFKNFCTQADRKQKSLLLSSFHMHQTISLLVHMCPWNRKFYAALLPH